MLRAMRRAAAGDKKGAIEDFDRAMSYPDNLETGEPWEKGKRAEIAFTAGEAMEKLGDKEAAKKYFERALEIVDPNDPLNKSKWHNFKAPEQMMYTAAALKKLGRDSESEKLWKLVDAMMVDKEKNFGSVEFYTKFGGEFNKDKALSELKYYLGEREYLKGNEAEAKKFYKEAGKIYPNNPFVNLKNS